VGHGFRLAERDDYYFFWSILTTFELCIIFGGSWGSIENGLKPKTEPPPGNLACPNPFLDLVFK
jgi:hypothetical protein